MNYSYIIDDMVWSYSRLTCFETCPYKFFLTYIYKLEQEKQFFTQYGSFAHKIIEKRLNNELNNSDVELFYLMNFKKEVTERAPNFTIYKNYFQQGLNYFKNFYFPFENIVSVEERVDFEINNNRFTGVIDAIDKGETHSIIDNKSRNLKNRSNRKNPTKSDLELDDYLKQLYLYSAAYHYKGEDFPDYLCFNCFRTNTIIKEKFNNDKYNETLEWANSLIDNIKNTTDWYPNVDYFFCSWLCDVNHHCEYKQMIGGREYGC